MLHGDVHVTLGSPKLQQRPYQSLLTEPGFTQSSPTATCTGVHLIPSNEALECLGQLEWAHQLASREQITRMDNRSSEDSNPPI